SPAAEEIVDLRNPLLAFGLALLLPGLGHFYQRRAGKAILFMVCILGTYFYGWALGGYQDVYACWEPRAFRHYGYFAQVWVGLPAWPAMLQASVDPPPLGKTFMTPPRVLSPRDADYDPKKQDGNNDLAKWSRDLAGNFEMGGVLTMVAGLLNV